MNGTNATNATNATNELDARSLEQLHAYHDGELRGLGRWRFERRLRRSPELRRELAALARVGALVREASERAPGPDLWDGIEQRLSAVDARRAEERERGPALGLPAAWLRPAGAVAVAAAAVAAVYVGIFQGPGPQPGVVRWIDSGERNVMVLESDAEAKVTIIWVLDPAVEGAARGGSGEVV